MDLHHDDYGHAYHINDDDVIVIDADVTHDSNNARLGSVHVATFKSSNAQSMNEKVVKVLKEKKWMEAKVSKQTLDEQRNTALGQLVKDFKYPCRLQRGCLGSSKASNSSLEVP